MGNGNNNNEIKAIKLNENIIYNKVQIAENMNEYFIESINKINESIGIPKNNRQERINSVNSLFKFKKVNVNDIKMAINEIKSQSDNEKITPEVLFDSMEVVGRVFSQIINESFETGIFPAWKCSIVTPIEKVRGTINPEEFRPINSLPTYEKVIEIIVKKQLDNYINENNILMRNQSGFRKLHSCESALNLVIEQWKQELDKNHVILCLFLDLKRAFETIDRMILIKKLEKIGIKNNERDWFHSYLTGRYQITKIDDVLSTKREINIGLPQGTVLSSLLFSLYINDLCDIVDKDIKINLFADDTAIYMASDKIEYCCEKMNIELSKLHDYFNENKLKLNISKTKFMIIKNKQKIIDQTDLRILIDNENIEKVSEIKYLGVMIDENIDFNAQTNYICKKAGQKVGMLSRMRYKLKIEQRLTIYKAIIAPHFDYCSSIIFIMNDSQLERIQKIQNRAMRAIMNVKKRTHIKLMLDTLGWLSIKQRVTFLTLKFIHKIIHGKAPQYLKEMIDKRCKYHNHNLRNNENININRCKRTNTQNSLVIRGFNMYNSLTNDIKQEKNEYRFENRLKQWIKNNIEQL